MFVEVLLKYYYVTGYKEATVDPEIGTSNHYRYCETESDKCWRRKTIVDKTAHRFTKQLGQRVNAVFRGIFGGDGWMLVSGCQWESITKFINLSGSNNRDDECSLWVLVNVDPNSSKQKLIQIDCWCTTNLTTDWWSWRYRYRAGEFSESFACFGI